jgi:hypothetical protein
MVKEIYEMKGKFTTFEIVKISGKVQLPDLVTILNYQFTKFILFQKINLSCLAKERCISEIVNLILLPLSPHTHARARARTHVYARIRIIWTHNSHFKGRVIRIAPQRNVLLLCFSTVNRTSVTLTGI